MCFRMFPILHTLSSALLIHPVPTMDNVLGKILVQNDLVFALIEITEIISKTFQRLA